MLQAAKIGGSTVALTYINTPHVRTHRVSRL